MPDDQIIKPEDINVARSEKILAFLNSTRMILPHKRVRL